MTSAPTFSGGALVWREVQSVIDGKPDIRNKLVLESSDGFAFSSYGVELNCYRINSIVMKDSGINEVEINNNVVKICKVCNMTKDKADEVENNPLYYPREYSAGYTAICVRNSPDHLFLINNGGGERLSGIITQKYIRHPVFGSVQNYEVLELSSRESYLLDNMHLSLQTSRFLQGAIFGEVRCLEKLYRVSRSDAIVYATLAALEVVYPGTESRTCSVPGYMGELVAVKTIRKTAVLRPKNEFESPLDEVVAMVNIDKFHCGKHSNIVRLLHCIAEDLQSCNDNQDNEMDVDGAVSDTWDAGAWLLNSTRGNGNIYILMPFYNKGDMFEQLNVISADHEKIKNCFKQVVTGLQYIHAARYNHRDLSCENIMYHVFPNTSSCDSTSSSIASPHSLQEMLPASVFRDMGDTRVPPPPPPPEDKELYIIIDFGMAIHIPPAGSEESKFLTARNPSSLTIVKDGVLHGRRVCGKTAYTPAEHFDKCKDPNESTKGFPSDVWAVGVILLIMLTMRHPFDVHDRAHMRNNYIAWLREIKEDRLGNRELRSPLLTSSGSVRQLRHHPSYSLLKRLLSWPEENRITVDDILKHSWFVE